jgi:hypothetical protein
VSTGPDRGSEGVVFWLGEGNRGERLGLRTDDEETVWADVNNVIVVEGKAPAAKATSKSSKSKTKATPSTEDDAVDAADAADDDAADDDNDDNEDRTEKPTKAKTTKATKTPKATTDEAKTTKSTKKTTKDTTSSSDSDETPSKIAKGMKVRWKTSRHDGTGVAFWIGKNKFGDGMRVGVKDDETGETVWANADDCEPA